VEIAAPPPSPNFFQWVQPTGSNTFRNPNGNQLDDDGAITGSIYHVRANGPTGSVTIDPTAAGIPPTTTVNVRVLATSGGNTVAEASDAGTVQYDGITPLLGAPLSSLFMNPNGSDGYLVEGGAFSAAGPSQFILWAYEPFDLQTGAVGGIPLSFTNSGYRTHPIVQNDVAVAVDTVDGVGVNYYRAAPLGAAFSSFVFPAGSFPSTAFTFDAAQNSTPSQSAYIALDVATNAMLVTRGDVTTGNGFVPAIDVTAFLGANFDFAGLETFAYDPGTDRAYMLVEDTTLGCDQQSPQLVTIDFTSGSASSRSLGISGGDMFGGGYGLAIDPARHMAAVATSCQATIGGLGPGTFAAELTLLDLSTGTTTRVFRHVLGGEQSFHGFLSLVGGDSATIGLDTVNHLILQRSMWCPALIGTYDMNARPCLNEYDESGRLVKTIPGLFGSGVDDPGVRFNGVNSATRTGVAMGQEAPGIFVLSTSVQPYSY
jgi:hypothetical protein